MARIIANGFLTATCGVPLAPRAALLIVNPTTAHDFNAAGSGPLQTLLADAARYLEEDSQELIAALDLLPIVAGGASQTWIAFAVGPPGSAWVFD